MHNQTFGLLKKITKLSFLGKDPVFENPKKLDEYLSDYFGSEKKLVQAKNRSKKIGQNEYSE